VHELHPPCFIQQAANTANTATAAFELEEDCSYHSVAVEELYAKFAQYRAMRQCRKRRVFEPGRIVVGFIVVGPPAALI
jgi:hypothetical protein